MNLIGEKIIRLQDAKFKLLQNNSNEASVFIVGSLATKLNLQPNTKVSFRIDKTDLVKLLCFTFSFKKNIFKKEEVKLDLTWFEKYLALINNHYNSTDVFTFEVKKQSQDRYYFIALEQTSGLNIRDLFIQDHVKLIFYSNENYIKIQCSESGYEENQTDNSEDVVENIIEKFADWFIKQDGGKNNYYTDFFGSNRDRLLENLKKYEDIYLKEFDVPVFTYSNNELTEFIKELEKNLYIDSGEFFTFSQKVSTHLPRAILGKSNYIRFLKGLLNISLSTQITFNCKSFYDKTEEAKLKFSEKLIVRFISSLCAKPFVICSGLSGSGKTKLAQSFVQWICESKDQYALIPVGADWTNREPLLGYPNGLKDESYITPDSGSLSLIIESLKPENSKKPYFLILDEMNLSHVERYFADFLSIMESNDKIKLYTGMSRSSSNGITINQQISWPKNLFIIGTVNIDETTYMFSPKVLDRANVIEFRIDHEDMSKYISNPGIIEMDKLLENPDLNIGYGASMAEDFLKLASKIDLKNNIDSKNTLINFFKELQKAGSEFGYRSTSEINNLIALLDVLTEPGKKWDGKDIKKENDFVDIAIMQKLLPKLHGSRNKLIPILTTLGKFCVKSAIEKYAEKDKEFRTDYFENENSVDVIYSLSFEKIRRMYHNAISNGFASYAEA